MKPSIILIIVLPSKCNLTIFLLVKLYHWQAKWVLSQALEIYMKFIIRIVQPEEMHLFLIWRYISTWVLLPTPVIYLAFFHIGHKYPYFIVTMGLPCYVYNKSLFLIHALKKVHYLRVRVDSSHLFESRYTFHRRCCYIIRLLGLQKSYLRLYPPMQVVE